jgi:hypothetical protein
MVLRQLRNNFKTSFWDFFSLNPKSETWTLRFGCLCYRFDSAKTERQNKETKIPILLSQDRYLVFYSRFKGLEQWNLYMILFMLTF